MTSAPRIAANRRNAARSSGPRTAAGKTRSGQNAFRHGLSLPIKENDAFGGDILPLAEEIVAISSASPEVAYAVAKARIELIRARRAALEAIEEGLRDQVGTPDENLNPNERLGLAFAAKAPRLASYARYERRAWSRLEKLLRLKL